MKIKIKGLFLSSLLFFCVTKTFAADATVSFVKGKVEVLKGTQWVSLNQGDELKKSDIVNTGFNSEAKIKLFDSVMYLGPVTRVSLEELSSSQGQDKVNVYLKTGNVRSQVNHTTSKRVSYQVKTAVAVASVRGTDWEIDDSNNITCMQGAVAAAPIRSISTETVEEMEDTVELPNEGVVVQANQSIAVSDSNFTTVPVSNVVQSVSAVSSAVSSAASKEAVSSSVATSVPVIAEKSSGAKPTGNITVVVSYED